MPTTTHILVDFENVQPGAADIALLRGEGLRLAIFRGPGQMKYAADLAEAWQPLGSSVQFIRCAKAGRNAVDMHIAFHLGALIDAHPLGAGKDPLRLVVVSRDTDFDPLLLYIRALGYDASRAASIKAALPAGDGTQPRPAKARASVAAPKPAPAAKSAAKTAAKKAPAKKAAVLRPASSTSSAPEIPAAAAPRPAGRRKAAPAAASPAASDALAKVIESLQHMGDQRPAKRAGLERHIESHLGRNLAPGVLPALLQQLEARGVLAFDHNKVAYRLPKDSTKGSAKATKKPRAGG